jgi:C-terminal processing protease CtpA/Prc
LKFNAFVGAEHAGATAVAAMNFLANVDALIVDLRENGGGNPSMIQLITSYFLEEPTHLNSFYIRKTDEMKQFWTQAHVAGPRLVDVPIWVLTSRYTFSGAEEFTYNLKNLERATIVGETTGGGAHPVEGHYFDFGEFIVTMSLPFGRAVNPITGTNWEGTGIEPHIQVPADQALQTAQLEALQKLQEGQTDEDFLQQITWARAGLEAELEPVSLSAEDLAQYTGSYGPRRIWHEGDVLWYQREDRPKFKLIPMGVDMFMLEGLAYFRIRFEKDSSGKVARIVGLYDSGHQDVSERSDG